MINSLNIDQFLKIFWLKFKKIKNLINIIPMILIVGISLLRACVEDKSGVILNAASLGTFLLIWKLIADTLTKKNVDQDRTMFLMNKKTIVFFAMTLANLMIFAIPLFLYIFIGILINDIRGYSTPTIANAYAYVLLMMFLYLLIWFFIIYIKSINIQTKNQTIFLFLILICVFYLFLPDISIWNKKFNIILSNNWIYLIPILNIVLLDSFASNNLLEWWQAIPFIIETLIIMVVFWKSFVTHVKEELCS